MSQVILKNNYILVKETSREKEELKDESGLFIPEENLDDEQVAQGIVVQDAEEYHKGDVILFHKIIPVDVNMKLEGDSSLQRYFFIKSSDIICHIK